MSIADAHRRDNAIYHKNTTVQGQIWGWLPALSVVAAIGVLVVAWADTAARNSDAAAEALFWLGLLILFVPIALRLVGASSDRRERIGLVVLLGLGLYFVKLFHSPLGFTFPDEFMHWRTADDILRHQQLFQENPLLPVSPMYPGLELLTSALASLGGLSIFTAGVIVIGVARLVLVLALYLFYEHIGRSDRIAGIATMLYMANPNFVFFDAQFAYESLSLPLMALLLWGTARHEDAERGEKWGWAIIALAMLGAIELTHHLTVYAVTGFLLLWALVSLKPGGRRALFPGILALLAIAGHLAWLSYTAGRTVQYLSPHVTDIFGEIINLLAGETVGRELFRTSTGELAPLWERLTGFASVGLILCGLPFGLLALWRHYRAHAAIAALGVAALVYPLSLAIRFLPEGAEISNRTSEFLFVAVAFVLALAIVEPQWSHRWQPYWRPAVAALAAIIFTGGVIIGWAPWARLPGAYRAAADARSIEAQGITAAEWMRTTLGPDNRITADRTNRLLMGSYGAQRPVTSYADNLPSWRIYFAPQLGAPEYSLLQEGRIQYVVVDRRLSSALPLVSSYFERGETAKKRLTTPIEPVVLTKFDRLKEARKIFDSGDIAIYDVQAVSHE